MYYLYVNNKPFAINNRVLTLSSPYPKFTHSPLTALKLVNNRLPFLLLQYSNIPFSTHEMNNNRQTTLDPRPRYTYYIIFAFPPPPLPARRPPRLPSVFRTSFQIPYPRSIFLLNHFQRRNPNSSAMTGSCTNATTTNTYSN